MSILDTWITQGSDYSKCLLESRQLCLHSLGNLFRLWHFKLSKSLRKLICSTKHFFVIRLHDFRIELEQRSSFPGLGELELKLILKIPELLMGLDCGLEFVDEWIFS